jgi:hypothetical protein
MKHFKEFPESIILMSKTVHAGFLKLMKLCQDTDACCVITPV